MTSILNHLCTFARADQYLCNEPMRSHTTFKVGGCADVMFFPETDAQVIQAIEAANAENVPVMVIGNGSNLIVRDNGIRGMVIVLGERYSTLSLEAGSVITAQAGVSLAKLASFAHDNSLSGLEFASGIPGTLGGGAAMNAGAYGGQLSDVLLDARVYLNGRIVTLTRDEMQMGYRTTLPLREGGIVLSVRFKMVPGDKDAIGACMKELNARRREKQPLNFPSAGSTFKRPEGYFAGALIEQAGLKGLSVGGAQVSEKHAGFIINTGNATACDILALIKKVQDAVLARFGVQLETEVRIVGE